MATPQTSLILTALLKDKYDFSIVDANGLNYSRKECCEKIRIYSPDIVLMTAISNEYYSHYHAIAAMAKSISKDIITIMGGVYPTVLSKEVGKDMNVDYLFLGHAEERAVEFLDLVIAKDYEGIAGLPGIGRRDSEGRMIITAVETYISSVKKLIQPDYSVVDIEPYIETQSLNYQTNSPKRSVQIVTSYGCPYNCVFCATRTVSGDKVVYRSVDDVLREVEFLIDEYRIQNVVVMDDHFAGDRQRIEKILNKFIDYPITWKLATVAAWHLDDELLELMKRSGCTQLTISVESGCKRVLRRIIRKPLRLETVKPIIDKCHELGLDIGSNFVIGFPGETWEELRETFRFAEECDFDVSHFHIATPLPGTDLYKIAIANKCLPDDFSFFDSKSFGFGRAFITTDEFTPQEVMTLRAYEWDRINFSTPEKIEKVARLYDITTEELNEHRRATRRSVGIHAQFERKMK